jgi:hypothetical protein
MCCIQPAEEGAPLSTTIPAITRSTEEKILARVTDGQQAILGTVEALARPVANIVPQGPKLSLPKELPTTQEVVDDSFAFVIKLVEAQRGFAADLLAAVSPVLRKATGHALKAEFVKAA